MKKRIQTVVVILPTYEVSVVRGGKPAEYRHASLFSLRRLDRHTASMKPDEGNPYSDVKAFFTKAVKP